ncbi:MAG: hypothetical protein R3191_03400 [Anaerolineales bacterium]|nr:hypothetical protein [Anaerolineales bacterium]
MPPDTSSDRSARAYRAFLLRAWAEDDQDERYWRFQLESSQDGSREHFPDLQGLVEYLLEELETELDFKDHL